MTAGLPSGCIALNLQLVSCAIEIENVAHVDLIVFEIVDTLVVVVQSFAVSFNGFAEWVWTDPEICCFLRFSPPLDGCLLLEFLDSFVFLGNFLFELVDAP